jgi:hypothetical protein
MWKNRADEVFGHGDVSDKGAIVSVAAEAGLRGCGAEQI